MVSRGILAIAKLGENDDIAYHLIPAEAARKIQEREANAIVLLNEFDKNEDGIEEDDPYAAYEIPDDLMW